MFIEYYNSLNFELYTWLIFTFCIVYGVFYGLRNCLLKFVCTLRGRSVEQSTRGSFFDCIWVLSVLYAIFMLV